MEYCVFMCIPCSCAVCLQLNRQRVFDRFKTRENAFFDKLEDDQFMDLYSMQEYALKTHLLAVKWGMGTVKMEVWRKHANFVQLILDNVAFKSHSWAVRELKSHFGGNEELSKSDTKVARRIIREASRPHHTMPMPQPQHMGGPWMTMQPQFGPPPPMMMAGPQVFPPAQPMMGPGMGPPGTFRGVCYKCNQTGHMAKNCPTATRGNFSQGGPGGGNLFRGRSFRRKRG